MQILSRQSISTMPHFEYVLKGIKSVQVRKGVTKRTRLPITPNILRRMKAVWLVGNSDYHNIMLWAACCTGFLRSGEVTTPAQFDPSAHLSFRDITLDCNINPTMARVQIKSFKTDPFRKGVAVYTWAAQTTTFAR